jgi:hypothetical protein
LDKIFKLASSGVTMRRIAIIIDCSRLTVERKLKLIASKSKVAHQQYLLKNINKTNSVLFDEMEIYEHTKCKPLSIALAVDNHTGNIIDAQVAYMNLGHYKISEELTKTLGYLYRLE